MSKNIRIIARLDIKGPNLVKGVHLEGLRVLGKPEDFAKYYYENGADELFYQDVVASLYERNSLSDIISLTAKRSFIPLTVGGGIRTIENISTALRAGADKVCINTAATKNPFFVEQATKKFGSSTIVAAIEAIKSPSGQYFAFVDNGREETGLEVLTWAKQLESLGVGEIIITSVDAEGTGRGYDIELTKLISQNLSIPVVAHGGAGQLDHLDEVIIEGKADAIAIASMIHYDFVTYQKTNMANRTEGNVSFLQSGRVSFNKISPNNILEIKNYLFKKGISCRTRIS